MPETIDDLSAVQIPATRRPARSPAVVAQFPCEHLVIGCGVAIFHVASARVVLCYHSRDHYWFLPKGRRDAGEETTRAAEREGFEEVCGFFSSLYISPKSLLSLSLSQNPRYHSSSAFGKMTVSRKCAKKSDLQSGYRNRVLPLPLPHRQPSPAHAASPALSPFVVEPLWTQLLPVSQRTQYLLFWYAAETLPPDVEASMPASASPYAAPPPFPQEGLSLRERVAGEPKGHEPRRWEGTGVDAEEALYESALVPVEEAVRRLGVGSTSGDVVRRGWEGVLRRLEVEKVMEE